MTESDYLQSIERAFAWAEEQVEAWSRAHDLDLECNRQGSSVLETEFENGQKIITNAQAPTQQLWLASAYGAHHFVLESDPAEGNASVWTDTRGFGRFESVFLDHAQRLSGCPLALQGPLHG